MCPLVRLSLCKTMDRHCDIGGNGLLITEKLQYKFFEGGKKGGKCVRLQMNINSQLGKDNAVCLN